MLKVPWVVLVESSDIGAGYTADAVRSLGLAPLFLCQPDHYQGDTRAQLERNVFHACDTTQANAIAAAVRHLALEPLHGVITTQDERLAIAAQAASLLGTRGIDPAVIELKDKAAVARLIPEFSPPTVHFSAQDIPLRSLTRLLEDTQGGAGGGGGGGEIIFKPTRGAGGLGAFTLRGVEALKELPDRLVQKNVPAHMGRGEWVAQAFIRGRLVSMEGYVAGGEVVPLGFTGRKKVGYTESAAMFPIDKSIDESVRVKAGMAVRALVKRSNFQNGYFHIEFMITDRDGFLIDANMGRIGGGAIAEQLALSFRVEPVQVYRHLLGLTLREGCDAQKAPYQRRDRRETYAIFYGLERGAVVTGVRVPAGTGCHHTQIIGAGTAVPAMGENDWAWVGILSGFTRDCVKAIKDIRIVTPDGEVQAYY